MNPTMSSVSFTRLSCKEMVAVETKHQGKKENEIKKTVFGIRSAGSGYELYVIEQQLN